MRRSIAVLLPLLGACRPTAADYLMARTWSARARAAVVADRSQCEPAQACSTAVQILASEGAGKAHVTTASAACILPARARGASVMDLGGLLAAADVIAKITADRMLEREQARLATLQQAGEDLDAEHRICR